MCWGLSRRNYFVVLGDLNARVDHGELKGILEKYGVPGEIRVARSC